MRIHRVIGLGFEPRTDSLEGYCSIQLSYPTIISLAVLYCRTEDTRRGGSGRSDASQLHGKGINN